MQAQRGSHLFGMRAFPDSLYRPDPQRLKSLVIQLPAVIVPHGTIQPDREITVGLLMNPVDTCKIRNLTLVIPHRNITICLSVTVMLPIIKIREDVAEPELRPSCAVRIVS